MGFLAESLTAATRLIAAGDREVVAAVCTSLTVSLSSTAVAALVGVPAGVLIGSRPFPLKRWVQVLLNTLTAMPTVVIGLLVFSLISRQGVLGWLNLLFTPMAMIVGQSLLAIPIVTHYAVSAIAGADTRIVPTAQTLGAGPVRVLATLACEVRFSLMAAIVAGFGRVIAEVGVAMMLGGNIRGYTRTMTTAIALETSKGDFAFGLALGIILMLAALGVNILLSILQEH